MRLRKQVVILTAAVLLLGACGDGDADTALEQTPPETQEAAQNAEAAARDAMESLRTDAERFANELQSSDLPKAKQALLDKCRDVVERLRTERPDAVDQAERACERIQQTDVTNRDGWEQIKSDIARLNPPG